MSVLKEQRSSGLAESTNIQQQPAETEQHQNADSIVFEKVEKPLRLWHEGENMRFESSDT